MKKEVVDLDNIKYYEVTTKNPILMKLHESKMDKLYHYTTYNGAKNIFKNNSLWITQSNFLDDASEIKYISNVVEGVITYLKDNKKLYHVGFEWQDYIYDDIIKVLEAVSNIYRTESPIIDGNIFLLSLTENKSNRFLIENYAGKDGNIIEFKNDIDTLFEDDFINKYKIGLYFAKVEYDYGEQLTIIIEDINEFYLELIHNIMEEKRVDRIDVIETIKAVIGIKMLNYSLFFKHMKFDKEQEYRIAFVLEEKYSDDLIKYRMKSGIKVPYIEVKVKKQFIKKLVCR